MEENGEKNSVRPQNKNLKPFSKGENGGAHRPLGTRNFETIYRAALEKLAKENNKTPEELEDEMLAMGIVQSRKGQYQFYKDMLDRLHGQATQKVNLSGNINISKLLDIAEKNNERPSPIE